MDLRHGIFEAELTAPSRLSGPISTRYAPEHPVDLAATLRPLARGRFDPTIRFDGGDVWRTMRTPVGAATMHLTSDRSGIVASAWGDGAEWAIAGVPELLGDGDDWSGCDVASVSLLADSARRNEGLRLLRTRQVFEVMAAAIFEQKVTGKEARHSWRVLLTKYGELPPGPAPDGMRVFASAETWRRIPSWQWHAAGVGPDRAATVVRVASVAASLERTLLLGRGGIEVEQALRSIPGVGVWTAAETMQRAHGDPDSPSFGDYHLPSVVGLALTGHEVDDDGMRELLEPWAGHRQRIVRLIEASGFVRDRRGPRATIQDHRAH